MQLRCCFPDSFFLLVENTVLRSLLSFFRADPHMGAAPGPNFAKIAACAKESATLAKRGPPVPVKFGEQPDDDAHSPVESDGDTRRNLPVL